MKQELLSYIIEIENKHDYSELHEEVKMRRNQKKQYIWLKNMKIFSKRK